MPAPLRVVITADPDLPVPPRLYGGIERVIALLVDGLAARGHEVTLVAHQESRTAGRLVPYSQVRSNPLDVAINAGTVTRAVAGRRPDVVHSFGRLATLAPILPSRIPKLMSYQRAVTRRSIAWGRRLSRGSLTFVSCSWRLIEGLEADAPWRVVYNAVDVNRYVFAADVPADAPLVFLGRVEAIKGAHVAIDVARRAGRRLILAGNVPPEHQQYFEQSIRPHLNGTTVTYIGPVDDIAKSDLLSNAAALLMPVLWEEPFGIVMAEALACGTPVIGFARGAVPEVVENGVTGFVCRDESEMDEAVQRIASLSRTACRRDAEVRFSQKALVDGYESLYQEVAGDSMGMLSVADQSALVARRDS